jgi:hypothetical protein
MKVSSTLVTFVPCKWLRRHTYVPYLAHRAVAAEDFLHTFVSALEVVGEAHLLVPYLAHRAVAAEDFLHTFVSALEVVGEAHVCTLPGKPGSCCGRLSPHICERPGGGWGGTRMYPTWHTGQLLRETFSTHL